MLASQLASLKASLAAAVDDCAQQLQDGLAGKADAAARQRVGSLTSCDSSLQERQIELSWMLC
jgi:hypothetical protein